MEKDLYNKMQDIKEIEEQYAEENKKFIVKDVQFIGTIEQVENKNGVEVKTIKDIFKVIEEMKDGSIVENYYDDEKNFIAGKAKNGKIYLSEAQLGRDNNIKEQIENMENQAGISLNEIEKQVEEIAKELGVDKEKVLEMSEIDLEQEIKEKEKSKEEAKITLQEDEKEESKDKKEQKEENKDALEKVQSKQEIDVNKRINERYTLGDILGIERGSKLIAVYSDAIENNENSTRFSFIIKKPDGSLEKAKMLEQVGGKQSDKNIYDINYDGSEVTKKSVQSSYKIDSSLAKNALITARIGQAGYIEVNYGEMDRTSHRDALTQQLETEHTFKTREQVREEFSTKKGTDNIKEDLEEIRKHEKNDCNQTTLEDADGDEKTSSHTHIEKDELAGAVEKIKKEHPDVERAFTDEEIEARIIKIHEQEKNKKEDIEKITMIAGEDLETDAYYIKTKEH